MAHFAQIDENNNVLRVDVVHNDIILNAPGVENEALGIAFQQDLYLKGFGVETNWKQTSYNNNFRNQFARTGYTYDAGLDAFITLQPYPSWVLDANADWQAPVPKPDDGKMYGWNEETLSWVETTSPV